MTTPSQAPPAMTEDAFQTRILELCAWLGLLVFHDHDSRRNNAGFPDLVIVGGPSKGVLYAELKTEKGRVRAEQATWLQRLRDAGQPAVVWRPADWADIQATLQALR